MDKSEGELHGEMLNRFIELANNMKEEGVEPRIVSAAMMTATGVYATYVAAGNEGGLAPSGVDKVVDAFRQQLQQVQEMRSER